MSPRGLAWPFPALFALLALLALLVARRRLDVVEVRGRSMAPTLLRGDRLLVARTGAVRVGDVVLAADPRDQTRELIKRVAGIGPQGIALRGDNPAASTDARAFGRLPPDAVRWRVVWRYWPPGRAGRVAPAPLALDEGGETACPLPGALTLGG